MELPELHTKAPPQTKKKIDIKAGPIQGVTVVHWSFSVSNDLLKSATMKEIQVSQVSRKEQRDRRMWRRWGQERRNLTDPVVLSLEISWQASEWRHLWENLVLTQQAWQEKWSGSFEKPTMWDPHQTNTSCSYTFELLHVGLCPVQIVEPGEPWALVNT